MGWRENGRQIFESFLARDKKQLQEAADWRAKRREEDIYAPDDEHIVSSISMCAQGDSGPLIRYLKAGRKFSLTSAQRAFLIQILENEPWKAPRGRRRDESAREAAYDARRVYGSWKNTNAEMGITDWGHRKEMKDESCRYGILLHRQVFPEASGPDFETVRQLIDRSWTRQRAR